MIDNSFYFDINKEISISVTHAALKAYSDSLSLAENLETGFKIFLDTNVLLDYYKISFAERKELKEFFTKNKEQILITKQIEREFLKHRIDHINSYQTSVNEFSQTFANIKSTIDSLKGGEIKGFEHYLGSNKILQNDYEILWHELQQINNELKGKLINLFSECDVASKLEEKQKQIEEIKQNLEGKVDIERNDDILEVFSQFQVVNSLTDEEVKFLKTKFDEFQLKYNEVKGEQKENWKYTFPGCGEEKKTEPYGDFVILHEILKYMKENDCNVVFLTNDVTKNDWLRKTNKGLLPYTHYITISHALTNKSFYIFQAKDKIRVSYDKIYVEAINNVSNEIVDEIIEETPIPIENTEIDNQAQSVDIKASEQQGPKVIGKIDLSTFAPISKKHSVFDEITEEEFLSELKASQLWAERYGDDFVGLRSFIVKYLGYGKGFDFNKTYSIKDKLLTDGKIEIYTHEPDDGFHNPVDAIRIKE